MAGFRAASWGMVTLMAMLTLAAGQQSTLELYYNALEEVAPNTFVGNVKTDSRIMERYSSSMLSSLRFRFLAQPSVEFTIDEPTGVIRTAGRIDRDSLCTDDEACSVTLDVVALVSEQMTFLEMIKVNVDIEDINDNWPQFPDTRISHQILESTNVGNGFVIPTAIDPDSGVNGIQDYELVSSSEKFQLSVVDKVDGSTDVRLVLIEPLDREAEDFYQVRVVAYDGGNPPKSGSVDVNIIVQDANDNDPMFDNVTYDVTIFENTPVDSTILRVHASDRDAGLYGQILYTFSDRTQSLYGHIFGIKNTTGDIYIKGEVDFEDDPVYHLVVTAFDRGPDSIPADATVIVRIQDINDNQPQITVNTLAATGTSSAEVLENADPGLFVAHLTVMDPDHGINGDFNCSLNDNSFDLQLLYETEYKIVTRIPLDREKQDEYSLAIVCEDFGPSSEPSTKHITVVVTDDNDNTPLFNQDVYSTEIMENNEPNLYITQVNATDADMGNNAIVHYRLHDNAGDGFYVDPTSGVITATKSFDREDNPRISFQVLAVDGGHNPRTGSATVVVEMLDMNDESPSFTHERYSFSLDENLPAGTEVGIVNAVDPDSDPFSAFSYGIVSDSGDGGENFVIDSHTGRITTTRQLDREEVSVYYLVVQAADTSSPPMSSTTTCTIYVSDKNDNEPVFEFPSDTNNSIYISNRVPVNYVISRVQAIDRDIGDNGNLSYSLFQGNHLGFFRMDPTFGVISIAKSVKDIDYHVFELQLKVQDKGFPKKYAFADMNIVVNKTIPFPVVTTSHILGGHNFTIVVSLACVSGLIMVCLVIAIVVIRRQDAERRNHKYNCRMEALKMLHASQENHKEPELDSTSSKALSNGSCSSDCDKPKKEVSFNLDIDERDCVEYSHNHDKSRQSWPSTIDHRTLEHPQACSSMLTTTTATPPNAQSSERQSTSSASRPDTKPVTTASHTFPRSWALTQRELEVHQLLQMLKDQDADSAYSGEGSNTDSGRGASEEGETSHSNGFPSNGHPNNGPYHGNHSHHMYGQHSLPRQRNSYEIDDSYSSGNQVVPQGLGSNNHSHNLSTSFASTLPPVREDPGPSSSHSYSSLPPRMQTFAPRPKPQPGSSKEVSRENTPHGSPPGYHGGQLNTGYVHPCPAPEGQSPSPCGDNRHGNRKYSPPKPPRMTAQTPGFSHHRGPSPIRAVVTPIRATVSPNVHRTPYSSLKPANQKAHQGCGSDAETEVMDLSDDETGMLYSCTDMSEMLRTKTPSKFRALDTIVDDDNTTTSGSYVVDPQDLCNEIDDLFFRDMVV